MNHYPMLHILVRWGEAIAIALACLIAAAGHKRVLEIG
jgi:hypothetical protein